MFQMLYRGKRKEKQATLSVEIMQVVSHDFTVSRAITIISILWEITPVTRNSFAGVGVWCPLTLNNFDFQDA